MQGVVKYPPFYCTEQNLRYGSLGINVDIVVCIVNQSNCNVMFFACEEYVFKALLWNSYFLVNFDFLECSNYVAQTQTYQDMVPFQMF